MKISIAALACIGWCVQLTSSFQTPSTRSPLSTTISHDRSVGGWSSSSTTTKTTALVPNKKIFDANNRLSATQLDASPLSALASSPLGAISVLAGIVVVHEAGHYLAARSYNITVEEFSVGFGPKLVGFEALGNEFNLRALPLGGYVRFPINYDVNATQKMENAAREAFMKRREEEEWGPVQDAVNLLTLGIWDDRRRKQKNQELATQAEEEMAKRNWFQKVTGSGRLSNVVKDDPEDFEIDYYDDPDLLQNRPWFQRAVVLSMGVIFNMILAFSLYFGEIRFGSGIPEPQFGSGVVVSQAPLKSGAADGLLKQGDVIVGINGNPLVLMTSKGPAGAQKQVGDVISAIRATPDGESVNLQIKRDDSNNNNNNNIDIAIKPKKADMASSPSIGVMLSPKFLETKKLSSDNTVEAAQMAYSYFAGVFQQTLDGFLTLVGTLLMGKGPPPGQSVSGPVGLIKTGTEVVSTKDLATVLAFAGALSVNLGVINALPLPALDGGQLLFVLAEAVTGRKIDQRIQEGITSAAVLLLLFFTLSTTFSDVGNILVSFNFK